MPNSILRNIMDTADKRSAKLLYKAKSNLNWGLNDVEDAFKFTVREQLAKDMVNTAKEESKRIGMLKDQMTLNRDKHTLKMDGYMSNKKKILHDILNSRSDLRNTMEKYEIKQIKDALKSSEISFQQKQQLEKIILEKEKTALQNTKFDLAGRERQFGHTKILNEIFNSRVDLRNSTEKYEIKQLKDVLKSSEISFQQKQQLEKIILEKEKTALQQTKFDLAGRERDIDHTKSLLGQERDFLKEEKLLHRAEVNTSKNDLALREMKLMEREKDVDKKNSVFGSNTLTAVIAGAGALKALDYGTKKYTEHKLNDTLGENVAFARMSNPELKNVDPDKLHGWMSSIHALAPSMAKDPGLSSAALQTVHRYGGNIDLATAKLLSEIGDKSKKAKDDKWSSDLGNYALASNILGA